MIFTAWYFRSSKTTLGIVLSRESEAEIIAVSRQNSQRSPRTRRIYSCDHQHCRLSNRPRRSTPFQLSFSLHPLLSACRRGCPKKPFSAVTKRSDSRVSTCRPVNVSPISRSKHVSCSSFPFIVILRRFCRLAVTVF